MPRFIRTGLTTALLAAIILLLNGGWSGLIIAPVVGAGAGLIITSQEKWRRGAEAARLGLMAGAVAGFVLFITQLFHDTLLASWAAFPPQPIDRMLIVGIGALVVSALTGLIFGGAQALASPQRMIVTFAFLGIYLLIYPFIDQATDLGWIGQMIAVLIFVLLALGLNIVVGYAGLLDLGYAAFFAIGAYTTGLLSSPQVGLHVNFWLAIWVAAAFAAISGIVLGAPTLPLRGDYLAIVTLGFGEIVPIVFRNLTAIVIREPITGACLVGCPKPFNLTAGEQGVNPIGRPSLPIIDSVQLNLGDTQVIARLGMLAVLLFLGFIIFRSMAKMHSPKLDRSPILMWGGFGTFSLALLYVFFFADIGEFQAGKYLPWYYLILFIIVFSVFFIDRLRDSRLGRAWTAIREDELAAASMGVNIVQTKLLAFSMGATFSGFAGAFYAAYISAIFPSTFDFSISVIVLCMVILGGQGNMIGVILGGLIITAADRLFLPQFATLAQAVLKTSVFPLIQNEGLRDFFVGVFDPSQLRLLLFGLTLVIMMLVRPEGLVPSTYRRREFHEADEMVGKTQPAGAAK